MSARPAVVVSATAGPLLARAAEEARRRFPAAPLVALLHWRAAAAPPAGTEVLLASEHRERPYALVRALRARGPQATLIVCEGESGGTALKALALLVGGERLVVREDGSVYRVPSDAGALARHLAARLGMGADRALRLVGAAAGLPLLVWAAWRWRRRAPRRRVVTR